MDRSGCQSIAIHLSEDATNLFDRVIYCAVISQSDGSLRLWDDILVTEAGAGGLFPAVLPYTPNAIAIYGYGIRSNSDDAKAAYANLKANEAGKLAQILTSRNATLEAITISETRGVVLEVGEDTGNSISSSQATIELTTAGNGTVSGGGVKEIGSECTITATADSGYHFVAWVSHGNTVSNENPYTFTVNRNLTLQAMFVANGGGGD